MESLNRKYENFKKCYEALGKTIRKQNQIEAMFLDNEADEDLLNALDAGIIKHFELTYETGWKFLKEYLLETHDKEALSPKTVFRACEDLRLFSPSMLNELIALADARNETTRIYSQILAKEVCNAIEKHYQIFGKILKMIQL
jgi:nucleotidyltransferase substrate binding protein (TIGR01987 family)